MTLALPPRGDRSTRLILLRHGEPDAAVHGRCYGRRFDPGLSHHGREQMRQTWRLIEHEPACAIYTSPSRRAIHSAALRPVDAPDAIVDQRLGEIDFGAFEGLTYVEIAARYPEQYDAWMTRPTEVEFPDGESFTRMTCRVDGALQQIRRRHAGQTVVTVAHGGVNRVALAQALGLDPRLAFRLAQGYACVNVIDYFGDEPVVRVMNAAVCPC